MDDHKKLTLEDLLALEFEPHSDHLQREFQGLPWRQLTLELSVACRGAVHVLTKTKAELVDIERHNTLESPDIVDDLFEQALEDLRYLTELIATADLRRQCAKAVVATETPESEMHAGRGKKGPRARLH
jgi:hypothetical protein